MKTCSDCKTSKEEIFFPKDKSREDGLHRQCKVCASARQKRYRERHPERIKDSQKKYREQNPEAVRASKRKYREANLEKIRIKVKKYSAEHPRTPEQIFANRAARLKAKYGLSIIAFNKLFSDQVGKCAICGVLMRCPCIDHCHKSGKVRDLLCSFCNVGLGNFKDSPERLRIAAAYLERHLSLDKTVK